MYNLNTGDLVIGKMKEIEKKSNDAWKFNDFKRDSLMTSIMNRLAFLKRSKKQSDQNNCVCVCEC